MLKGKGFWIWKVANCEEGDPTAIADMAEASGFSHVAIKIANGLQSYNLDVNGADLVRPVVLALRGRGIQVWGWHYVYGFVPQEEARRAVQRLAELELDGYIVNAEAEFKLPGKGKAATTFMNTVRAEFPKLPIALSSYRYPSYHPQFPWREFLEKCDLVMPQVYWEQAHNPGVQLRRCLQEFQVLKAPFRPVIPTGPGYKNNGWRPSISDALEFIQTVQALGLPGHNWFSWDECRRDLPDLWEVICGQVKPAPAVIDRYQVRVPWRWIRRGPGQGYLAAGHFVLGNEFEVRRDSVKAGWGQMPDGRWVYIAGGVRKLTK